MILIELFKKFKYDFPYAYNPHYSGHSVIKLEIR